MQLPLLKGQETFPPGCWQAYSTDFITIKLKNNEMLHIYIKLNL